MSVQVTTRDIRPSTAHTSCDVCGRTMLRGERAETYLDGVERRSVCELCTARAVAEGWIREGTVPSYPSDDGASERRRSLLGRLRRRRESPRPAPETEVSLEGPSFEDQPWAEEAFPREPRHVRAVPMSGQQKVISAMEAFNASEHPRTVSGIARSLGAPIVSVRPDSVRSACVSVVVSWELCWYRYEVDLAEEDGAVQLASQGAELDELDPEELEANAVSDEQGSLQPAA